MQWCDNGYCLGKRLKIMKRQPYIRGCKDFLTEVEVGTEVEVPEGLRYTSVRSVACRLWYEYGCQFTFRTHDGKHYAKRIK